MMQFEREQEGLTFDYFSYLPDFKEETEKNRLGMILLTYILECKNNKAVIYFLTKS